MYLFNGIFTQRLYKSQLRPKEMKQACVHGNSLEGVLQSIWNHAKKLVRRQVIFQDDVPHWSDKQDPGLEDIGDFVSLQDTNRKRIFLATGITPRVLTSWRNKSVKIFVYEYSTNVKYLGQYQQVMRKLIASQNPDRSGAHSTRMIQP